MEIKQIIENSNLAIPKDNILYNEDMKKHTTFKIGGPAECFIKIKTKEELKEILVFARENKIPITILGNGSNILVLDGGIKGITLTIQIEYLDIKQDDEKYHLVSKIKGSFYNVMGFPLEEIKLDLLSLKII